MSLPMREAHEGYRETHVVITSQVVRDLKVSGGSRCAQLSADTARLRAGLLNRHYIDGDKVNCEFRPLKFTDDGALMVEIFGGMLRGSDVNSSLDPHFHHPFHLDLRTSLSMDDLASMTLEDLLMKHCNGVTVDDGGNAQNMVINMCLATVSSLRQKIRFTVFSSSDPLKRLPDHVRDRIERCLQYYPLKDVPDRIGIHLPWQYEGGKKGTFGISTEPVDTSAALANLLAARHDIAALLKSADCFITCDPSFEVLRARGQPARYSTIVNAATKWRSLIAGKAYGTDMILPMNHKEAADVAHVIRHVGKEKELHDVARVPFPTPLKPNGNEVDADSLRQLDGMLLDLATKYNPLHHRSNGLVAFNFPITFEEYGGLVAGTRDRRSVVAFTSTPDERAERELLERYGDPNEMDPDGAETMGAGDASASVVAIFNTIDPQEFIEPFLEGREKSNARFHQSAQTIFVSAMSRIVGMFLIHTRRTHLANISLQHYRELMERVAKESIGVARTLVSTHDKHRISDMQQFGMKVVTWTLGSL